MPTYAIIDSQSVKTASSAHDKGFDGGKKIKGRKRHRWYPEKCAVKLNNAKVNIKES
ncbi:transposase [Kingella kingae]|uniref:Uncharacterized protein n=1 Tax=Kingella kingae TaxID=504 RepID=A0AAX2J2K8_KINKI|nr:transposase [Kingella kingae]UOP03109.1 hypothetical protein LVJ79_00615 [Kingella kingae]SQH24302.1 Uncharacterised protein [Kingella kingae]